MKILLFHSTNKEIKVLKEKFYDMYGEDLAVKMASELTGNMEKFITACLQAEEEPFNPEVHTEEKAEEDAGNLTKPDVNNSVRTKQPCSRLSASRLLNISKW